MLCEALTERLIKCHKVLEHEIAKQKRDYTQRSFLPHITNDARRQTDHPGPSERLASRMAHNRSADLVVRHHNQCLHHALALGGAA